MTYYLYSKSRRGFWKHPTRGAPDWCHDPHDATTFTRRQSELFPALPNEEIWCTLDEAHVLMIMVS